MLFRGGVAQREEFEADRYLPTHRRERGQRVLHTLWAPTHVDPRTQRLIHTHVRHNAEENKIYTTVRYASAA